MPAPVAAAAAAAAAAAPRPRGNSPNTNSPAPVGLLSQVVQQPQQQQPPPQQVFQQQQQQPTQQPQPQQQQQQQPQRPAYPWSARRLHLQAPVLLPPKPGAPAPPAPSAPSPSPFPRYGHAIPATATAAGEIFLFGGLVREAALNDLYVFSTRDLSATLLQTTGETPAPRVGHACALVSSVLVVWGGDTKTDARARAGEKQDDSLYLLNLGPSRAIAFSLSLSCSRALTPAIVQRPASGRAWPCRAPAPSAATGTP